MEDRIAQARKHYWASCGVLAHRRSTTKEKINELIKASMGIKSHKDMDEEQLRELSAGLIAQAYEGEE